MRSAPRASRRPRSPQVGREMTGNERAKHKDADLSVCERIDVSW